MDKFGPLGACGGQDRATVGKLGTLNLKIRAKGDFNDLERQVELQAASTDSNKAVVTAASGEGDGEGDDDSVDDSGDDGDGHGAFAAGIGKMELHLWETLESASTFFNNPWPGLLTGANKRLFSPPVRGYLLTRTNHACPCNSRGCLINVSHIYTRLLSACTANAA